MNLQPFASPVLALLIGACGALVLTVTISSRRRRLAERVALVAPEGQSRGGAREDTLDGAWLGSEASRYDASLIEMARLCRRLRIAPGRAVQALQAFRAAAAVLFTAAAYAVLHLSRHAPASAAPLHITLSITAGVGGWFAPLLWLRRRAGAHTKAVSAGLPDALELLVVCAEAGLALEDALDRVTVELRVSQPDLAEELAMTSADLKILPDRAHAFSNLARRVGTPAMRSVVTTLSQTLRYGTPLAAALRVAAGELRNEAILALEERAGRLPALMTIPLTVFILPTIFIIVGGPALLRLLDLFANKR